MKTYQCHKTVQACKIDGIDIEHGSLVIRSEGRKHLFSGTDADRLVRVAEPGGYLVRYKDGYCSYSPAAAFEEGYAEKGSAVPAIAAARCDIERLRLEAGDTLVVKTPAGLSQASRESLAEALYDAIPEGVSCVMMSKDFDLSVSKPGAPAVCDPSHPVPVTPPALTPAMAAAEVEQ